ncbi:MAG: substrate-binding domain-containing protein [Actinomycetes bacterium]
MSPSIREVAKKAGVSLGTVSNAINRPEILAPGTLRKVNRVIEELGFVPNASARKLRVGRTRVIGLMVPDISNPFFTDLAKGVSEAALAGRYVVILCNTDESSEKELQYLDVLTAQNVEGILITPARDSNRALVGVAEKGIRLVLVDRIAQGLQACSVAFNDSYGGTLAIDHLYENGHRKILLLTGEENIPQVAERNSGLRKAMSKFPSEDATVVSEIRIESMTTFCAYEAMRKKLENPLDFTGIICGNDLIALGAIRALRERNISVPGEVSVIGYDDIDFARSAAVPLTSISQPAFELGYAAAELLISECEYPERHVHQRIEFQPNLVVRESTGPASEQLSHLKIS